MITRGIQDRTIYRFKTNPESIRIRAVSLSRHIIWQESMVDFSFDLKTVIQQAIVNYVDIIIRSSRSSEKICRIHI